MRDPPVSLQETPKVGVALQPVPVRRRDDARRVVGDAIGEGIGERVLPLVGVRVGDAGTPRLLRGRRR